MAYRFIPVFIARPAWDLTAAGEQQFAHGHTCKGVIMKTTLKQLAAGAVAALSLGLMTAPALAADTIRIGSFLSVTGPASFLGDPELKTLELYIDKLNEDGGLLGKQVELVHYDDVGDAANHSFEDTPVRGSVVPVEGTEAQAVHRGDGPGAHRENVADNPTHTCCRALKRFHRTGMIVALDLE